MGNNMAIIETPMKDRLCIQSMLVVSTVQPPYRERSCCHFGCRYAFPKKLTWNPTCQHLQVEVPYMIPFQGVNSPRV